MNEDTNLQISTQPPLVIADVSRCPSSIVYLEDCVQGLKRFADKHFDLAIVDPPYGIGAGKRVGTTYKEGVLRNKKGFGNNKLYTAKKWDNEVPPAEYWNELFRVSKNQIVWGGNYFELPLKKGWICWDKCNPLKGKFSDFELAWTSFLNCDRIYKQEWIGFGRNFIEKDKGIHPTQKPKRLYDWIFKEFSKKGDLILDTHLGSQSSRIAANKAGLDFVGFEIDREYFDNGNKRFKNFVSQGVLF